MSQENSAKYFLAKYSKKYGKQYKPDYVTEIPVAAKKFIDNNQNFAQNSYAGKFNFQHNESGFLHSKSIAIDEALKLLNSRKQTAATTVKQYPTNRDKVN